MTGYNVTLDGEELCEVVCALSAEAANHRKLVETCGDIKSLADCKAKFQARAERLDALANRLNLSPWSE